MKLASCFAALVTANECGQGRTVVRDGHFPVEFQATQKTYTVDHAIHFDITYGTNFKVLNNDLAKEQYVLTMCNSEAPKDAEVDALAPLGADFTRKHFTVPLQSYGTDTTGPQGQFDILGVHDRQMYVSPYASSPCLQKAVGCEEAEEPVQLCANAWGDEAEVARHNEQIESVDGYFRDYGNAASPKTIAVHSYLDPHVLNRAEWIKFIAAFFNKEDIAEKHMKEEEEKWEALSAEAAAKDSTPHVAFISASTWSGHTAKISLAAYKTGLVAAAGGKSFTVADFDSNEHAVVTGVDPNPELGFNMTDPDAAAAFRDALAQVDVLIDEAYAYDPAAYNADSFMANYGFDGAGARIYREDGSIGGIGGTTGSDWFEGAYANPSVVLADFVAAMYATDGEKTYLRELDTAPVRRTADGCALDLPACADVEPALIEHPCVTYKTCPETTSAPTTAEDQSSCIAAGLLLAAAAFS